VLTSPEVSLYPFEAGARSANWSDDDTWSGSVFVCIDWPLLELQERRRDISLSMTVV